MERKFKAGDRIIGTENIQKGHIGTVVDFSYSGLVMKWEEEWDYPIYTKDEPYWCDDWFELLPPVPPATTEQIEDALRKIKSLAR